MCLGDYKSFRKSTMIPILRYFRHLDRSRGGILSNTATAATTTTTTTTTTTATAAAADQSVDGLDILHRLHQQVCSLLCLAVCRARDDT
jgi:hypothetical protein